VCQPFRGLRRRGYRDTPGSGIWYDPGQGGGGERAGRKQPKLQENKSSGTRIGIAGRAAPVPGAKTGRAEKRKKAAKREWKERVAPRVRRELGRGQSKRFMQPATEFLGLGRAFQITWWFDPAAGKLHAGWGAGFDRLIRWPQKTRIEGNTTVRPPYRGGHF
jgi:hypothetical protein